MDRLQKISARMNSARAKGAKTMWYMVLADTVVDVLSDEKPLTRQGLIAELKRRQQLADNGPLLEEAYELAVQVMEEGAEVE